MQLIPVPSPVLKQGDDLCELLVQAGLQSGDIVVISSKAVATIEGAMQNLSSISPTTEAGEWAKRCGGTPQFRQAVLNEVQRLNGKILPGCPQAMLTELRPEGIPSGTILVANAGLDESNAPEGYCIGWPRDPVESVRRLRRELENQLREKRKEPFDKAQDRQREKFAIILSDSTCRPRRIGVTAIALVVSGLDPVQSSIGKSDLFGKKLRMTQEAVADQLATASNFLMGNAAQAIPMVIIRDHDIPLSDYEGWVAGIEPQEDLFQLKAESFC